jgi:hypothetical protein
MINARKVSQSRYCARFDTQMHRATSIGTGPSGKAVPEATWASDVACDVPATWDERFVWLDDHLDRLEQNCAKLRLINPLDPVTL